MPDEPAGDERIVVLGRCAGAYGVMGWIRVETYTDRADALLAYREWWLRAPRQETWRNARVLAARLHGQHVVAQLTGVGEREAAERLKGSEIGVPRSALPATAEDEIYWSDLVDMTVVNREGAMLGRITGVTTHGAHPLLEVQDDTGTARLIPYVAAIVDEIDREAGRVLVDWDKDY